jgi:DNA-binding LytR/AlgR family response regulator
MILTILIIEDERPNADRLKRLIKTLRPQAFVVAVLDSVADSVAWFRDNPHPDMVLMDIRLSDGLSFAILDQVQIQSPVIFTTAYDEYAVKAFKYNSIDYLLKPVEPDELDAALAKCEARTGGPDMVAMQGLLQFLQPKECRTRFLLPYKDGYKTVLVKDVSYFYSELKITRARLRNGMEEVLPQTLEELEQQLDAKLFFRANRQYIVHIDDIYRVHNYFNGKLKLEIKNNPEADIVVSRDKAQPLRNWMDF